MTTTLTQFEAEVLKETEKEFEMGGLSSGLYADYAIAVSRKISKQQREMIRKEIGNELLKRMMKYDSEDGYSKMHDEVMEKVARDVDDIFLPPPQ